MAKDFARAFYKSQPWQKVRGYVLARDRYLCVRCKRPAEEVHHKIHLTPQNINDPTISLNEKNLISLCSECHKKEHETDRLKGRALEPKCKIELASYSFDENGNLVPVSDLTTS